MADYPTALRMGYDIAVFTYAACVPKPVPARGGAGGPPSKAAQAFDRPIAHPCAARHCARRRLTCLGA